MWDVREPQVWQKAHRLTREPKRESRGTVEVRAGTAWPPECNDHDDLHARTGPWGGGGAVRRPMDRLTEPTGGPGEIGGSAYHGRDDGGSEPRWGVGLG